MLRELEFCCRNYASQRWNRISLVEPQLSIHPRVEQESGMGLPPFRDWSAKAKMLR